MTAPPSVSALDRGATAREDRRAALHDAVNRRLPALLADAAAEVGVTVAPDADQATAVGGDASLTVDLDNGTRADLRLDGVVLRAHIPPGWTGPPRHSRGDVIVYRAADHNNEVVVTAVLGDRADSRPGYRLRSILRRADGSPDTTTMGAEQTVSAALVDDARRTGSVAL